MVSSSDDTNTNSVSEPVSGTPSISVSPSVLNISILSAAAFSKVMHSDGAQCFSTFIRNPVKVSGHHV